MTVEWAISLLAVPVVWALMEWRAGLLLCLATAILQDPLRKLAPDQPVLFVVFVGVVFGGACLGALSRGISLNPNAIFERYRLVVPFAFLMLLIVVQAANSYVNFENLMITMTGTMTYVLPLFSLAFAYQLGFRQGEFRINQFMKWYIVCISLALATVYVEYTGYHWSALGQVGPKLIMYDRATGAILTAFSGVFRASEIAAWHAMTAACFVVLTIFLRKPTLRRLLTAVVVVALLIGVGSLTGRRKIGVEFAVFAGTYLILWLIFEKRIGKIAIIASITAVMVGYALLATQLEEPRYRELYDPDLADYSSYVRRSESAFQDAPSRFVELGVGPILWAYDRFGFLGAGLGVGTQGTQHFGGGGEIAASAEGGLGKITLELGIPGLFVMGWLGISVFRRLWRIMRAASQHSPRIARMSFGLFSFIVANLAGFSVATQAYGDLFILLVLSWTLGFLFAVPVLVEREVRARQPSRQLASFEELAPVFQPKTV